MKKNIIISLVLLLLIVMFGSCACSRGYSEGFTGSGSPETVTLSDTLILISLDKDVTTFDKTQLLSNAAALAVNNYVAFIDETSGSLKIAKVASPATQGKVIWDSAKSNPLWKTSTPPAATDKLTLTSTGSSPTYTAKLTLGLVDIVNTTITTQATTLAIVDGDLVIKDASSNVLWSLLDSELQSAKAAVNAYVGSTSNITNGVGRQALINKLQNLDNYIQALPATTATDLAAQKTMAELRRQMDFEIGELNGNGGSKLAVSTNTLQSTMYLNLGITVLAASLFVLIVTR